MPPCLGRRGLPTSRPKPSVECHPPVSPWRPEAGKAPVDASRGNWTSHLLSLVSCVTVTHPVLLPVDDQHNELPPARALLQERLVVGCVRGFRRWSSWRCRRTTPRRGRAAG